MKKVLKLLCLVLLIAGMEIYHADGIYATEAGSYQDGTYVGWATGFGGPVSVTMTTKDGRIVALVIQGEKETPGIGGRAIDYLTESIIAANGIDNVDVVAGATRTSRAILAAAAECIEAAYRGDVASSTPDPTASPTPKPTPTPTPAYVYPGQDGLYIAQAKGFGGSVVVIMTVKQGRISSLVIEGKEETQGIGSMAIDRLTEMIISANGIKDVDVVAGATYTSRAVLAAAAECLEASHTGVVSTSTPVPPATPTPTPKPTPGGAHTEYQDGTYCAQAKGFGGPVTVRMTTKDGWIIVLEIQGEKETPGIGGRAIEYLTEMIIRTNGINSVDVVAGATITSRAILDAAAECIEAATVGSAAPGIPGDQDGDGAVTLADAILILQYGAGENVGINASSADVNGDGQVNLYDALLIFQHEAGWNVELR